MLRAPIPDKAAKPKDKASMVDRLVKMLVIGFPSFESWWRPVTRYKSKARPAIKVPWT